MYIESVPNRNSPPAILLRESYRDAGKIKKRTIANLSDWPTEIVEGLRTLLKGGKVAPADQESIIVRRALPHGHVAALLGTLRNIGLDRMLGPPRNRCRDLVIAMIVARLIAPASKLATARMLDPLTASSSLGEVLGLGPVDEDELYVALDWLGERQEAIEKALARKHLHDGTLVLYDVSSSYVEGRCCELARLGYNRDGKKGKLQIAYGLLCAADGCPVAIEVFEGDTGDPRTLAAQIDKVKKRFALERVALVGDRGMITQARLDAEIAPAGLDWITALRAPAIRTLVEAGALQMSLFDQRDMAAITSPDYPGERLIVCRNPDLARERTRKREDLLAATEADLAVIAAAVRRARNPLRGEAEIALKVGAVVNRHKVAKHFELSIGEASFSFHRKTEAIAAEAALDGIYVVRTNLPKKLLDDAATVGAYKSLARVERAFRSLKTVDIHLRPIFHWTTPRVRAHVLLCMLAYHVEHHMRARLAPMLYDETDHEAAAAMRASIVAKAERSEAARRKQTTGLTDDGLPVHSFQSLLADLATYARIQATTALNDKYVFKLHTRPTPIQQRAFELLALNPDRTQ
ncbi:MAG TPA: IS1634 family transposase [Xanthobacteraceae bacterium]|jgi:transposase|nr:IS1634 family transposase [Xanthobacteraceae bacterium]